MNLRPPEGQILVPPYDRWFPILLTKNECQIIVASCKLHNLALQRQVPFLHEDGPDGGIVAAVEPVGSEEEETEEEDIDNQNNIIMQYFQ
ncbi:hypothetical protein NDU88_004627 [Pleurodeles waltl]|uniref:Uncharacterized protein n=1 Tax=Pleurodeles waltl TaxID=8319 RepID=A0AAV7MVP1_PLEWA|nr:hypothetical protein NDU88_004627 [Pleurodeles waltl]